MAGWGGDPGGAELGSQQQRDRQRAQRAQRDTFRKYTCCQSMPLKKMCSFTSCALGKRRERERVLQRSDEKCDQCCANCLPESVSLPQRMVLFIKKPIAGWKTAQGVKCLPFATRT